jgi:hypothetical protein
MANTVVVKDAGGANVTVSTLDKAISNNFGNAFSTSLGNSQRVSITDPTTGQGSLVQAFHNVDNQVINATSYGMFTGGVAQLVNILGNLDRARETAFDNIPAAGVTAGAEQLASPTLVFTITGATSNATTANLNANSITNSGVVQNIANGSTVLVDSGNANQEYVFITGVSGNQITGTFTKLHGAGVTVQTFAYNQARDATSPDGSTPVGISAMQPYLYNGTTMDRQRGNLPSVSLLNITAANTANLAQSSALQTNYNHKGAVVTFNCTSNVGSSCNAYFNLQVYDTITANYATVANSITTAVSNVAGSNMNVWYIYPGAGGALTSNTICPAAIPRQFRVQFVPTAPSGNTISGNLCIQMIV